MVWDTWRPNFQSPSCDSLVDVLVCPSIPPYLFCFGELCLPISCSPGNWAHYNSPLFKEPGHPDDSLGYWFSNWIVHQKQQEGFLKHKLLGLHPQCLTPWSRLRIWVPNRFPGAAGQEATLRSPALGIWVLEDRRQVVTSSKTDGSWFSIMKFLNLIWFWAFGGSGYFSF